MLVSGMVVLGVLLELSFVGLAVHVNDNLRGDGISHRFQLSQQFLAGRFELERGGLIAGGPVQRGEFKRVGFAPGCHFDDHVFRSDWNRLFRRSVQNPDGHFATFFVVPLHMKLLLYGLPRLGEFDQVPVVGAFFGMSMLVSMVMFPGFAIPFFSLVGCRSAAGKTKSCQ
mgnify:CR=1 FL=1